MRGYTDIIHLQRPISAHPRMRREDRAKIFAPFAALNGHGDAIHARDKALVPRPVLTEHTQAALNEKLRKLRKGDWVTVIYFVTHKRNGEELLGEYVTVSDGVTRVDEIDRRLYLRSQGIPFEDLYNIRIGEPDE